MIPISLPSIRDLIAEVNAQWDALLAPEHLLTVGLVGLHERLRSERLAEGRAQRSRASIYLQHEWTPLKERLAVVPGLRASYATDAGANLTPKVALRYTPNSKVTLRTSYGRGFRAPGFRELLLAFENPSAGYVVVGNPDLSPESSHSLNAGVVWAPIAQAQLEVSGHINWIKDLIAIATNPQGGSGSDQYTYTNIGRARTAGVEAQLNYRPWAGLHLGLGYTLLDARDLQAGRGLEGRARHRVSAQIRAGRSAWGLFGTVRGAWVSSRPYYPTEATVVLAPSYLDLRLRVEKTLGDRLTVFIGADNLLSAGDPNYLQIPPRAFYAGLDAQI